MMKKALILSFFLLIIQTNTALGLGQNEDRDIPKSDRAVPVFEVPGFDLYCYEDYKERVREYEEANQKLVAYFKGLLSGDAVRVLRLYLEYLETAEVRAKMDAIDRLNTIKDDKRHSTIVTNNAANRIGELQEELLAGFKNSNPTINLGFVNPDKESVHAVFFV